MTTTTTRSNAPVEPMDPMRKTALIAGVLYLVTFVGSMPALGLYHAILNNPNYLLGHASDTGVLWGAVGEIVCALAGIATAVVLYPVAKRNSQNAAMGFLMSRTIEAAMIFVGVLSVLSLVTLHGAGVSAANAGSLVTTGHALVAVHNWTFLLGPGVMPAINALCIGTVMYRTGLVPRMIPKLGLIGAPILLASALATLFGAYSQVSAWSAISALPIATWEFSFGVWMTVKGFRPAAIAELQLPAAASTTATHVAVAA